MSKEQMQKYMNDGVEGLAAQGFQQAILDNSCLYRGPNNLKCFVGQIVTDEQLEQAKAFQIAKIGALGQNNEPAFSMVVKAMGLTDHGDILFLRSCQAAHDRSTGPFDMKNKLRDVCLDHELDVPPELANPA